MTYFVTGATGFIGRHLVQNLLRREGTIYVLVREGSTAKLDALVEQWDAQDGRVVPVVGDLAQPGLGVCAEQVQELRGKVRHMFHLAAVYDLKADAASQVTANIGGTRHAVELAQQIEAGCLHHTSSIAAAGMYDGVFREDMFEEANGLEHPYFRTKHDAEGIVRNECQRPWRVYRPGIVVGHSVSGEIDKIDGPYYFFKLLQKFRQTLPPWMPTIGLEGGRMNLVPVDFVADAMDHIAHQEGLDGRCFHLTDPNPRRVGQTLNIFAGAGHAPQMAMRINTRMFGFIPSYITRGITGMPPVKRMIDSVLDDLGIPRDVMQFMNYPTRFDSREADKALEGTDIRVPELEDYAWRLWDYWERHLDPDLYVDHSLSGKVRDKVVMVTGASSGIGRATAIKIASAGAKVLLVARGEDKLLETHKTIEDKGGTAFIYTADLSDLSSCDALVRQVVEDHGNVDILVNNAGRSIRRSITHSFERFHDFERTMQLNYFGSLRLIMGFLPAMLSHRSGHVINISSIGVLSYAPRFSAYVASKSALDAFSRCASSEFSGDGIYFTTINMPLVRTPMIAPTKVYDHVPTIGPEEAADLVVDAIITRKKQVATRLGVFMAVMNTVAPKLTEIILNTAFRLFPDSSAAHGTPEGEAAKQPTSEMVAFAQITRGIHW